MAVYPATEDCCDTDLTSWEKKYFAAAKASPTGTLLKTTSVMRRSGEKKKLLPCVVVRRIATGLFDSATVSKMSSELFHRIRNASELMRTLVHLFEVSEEL